MKPFSGSPHIACWRLRVRFYILGGDFPSDVRVALAAWALGVLLFGYGNLDQGEAYPACPHVGPAGRAVPRPWPRSTLALAVSLRKDPCDRGMDYGGSFVIRNGFGHCSPLRLCAMIASRRCGIWWGAIGPLNLPQSSWHALHRTSVHIRQWHRGLPSTGGRTSPTSPQRQ